MSPGSKGGQVGDQLSAGDGAVLNRDFLCRPESDRGTPTPTDGIPEPRSRREARRRIQIKNVTKQFGRNRILNGLDLDLPDDQISMVLGPSGTGKSVFLKPIVVLKPEQGQVLIDGETVSALSAAARAAQEVRRALPGRRALRLDERLRQRRLPAARAHQQGDRGPGRGDLEKLGMVGLVDPRSTAAGRALRRHEEARRPGPVAGDGPRDRPDRRARLGPRPGPHCSSLRADQGSPRREWRLLPGDQPRPRHCPADRRLHRSTVEGPDRRKRSQGRTVRVQERVRPPVSPG